jgi:pyruvate formate lyase activating enzyme
MKIAGWQITSLIDYPGKISTVLFTSGCNWKCFYCHNYKMVTSIKNLVDENEIKDYLWQKRNKLDAVVISGGEPTLQSDLIKFLKCLKKMKLKIKLDTNGSKPEIIKNILDGNLVDYVAMDIKSGIKKYDEIIRTKIDFKNVKKSIELIMKSGIDYEFRTTVFKIWVNLVDLREIGKIINGAKKYFLQNYVYRESIENGKNILSYSEEELEEMIMILKSEFKFGEVGIR